MDVSLQDLTPHTISMDLLASEFGESAISGVIAQ